MLRYPILSRGLQKMWKVENSAKYCNKLVNYMVTRVQPGFLVGRVEEEEMSKFRTGK